MTAIINKVYEQLAILGAPLAYALAVYASLKDLGI